MVRFHAPLVLSAALAAAFLSGCGDKSTTTETGGTTGGTTAASGLKGKVAVDGSSTVFPIVNLMGSDFSKTSPDVALSTSKSGTGSGFTKFAAGEIDVCTASRPIKDDEDAKLKTAGIEYVEVPIAYDGVSVIVSPENTWLKDVTAESLKAMYGEGSNIAKWSDADPSFPGDKVQFYGPSDNHGTYEYFQEAILGKKANFRRDYQANQEYNAIVESVAGDKNAIAYVGYNYFAENSSKLRAVPVGGVLPSDATIADGTYSPLSRPLFVYVAKKAYARPEVKALVDFMLSEQGQKDVAEAKYVPLPKDALDAVKARVAAGTAGSAFMTAEAGKTIPQILGAK